MVRGGGRREAEVDGVLDVRERGMARGGGAGTLRGGTDG